MEPTANSSNAVSATVDSEASALQRIISEFSQVTPDARQRLIDTVCTFFGLTSQRADPDKSPTSSNLTPPRAVPFRFSEDETPTAKRFLQEKAPDTDVERVACLAYYLTQFRNTPHFKTKDITDLNTEAAQRRFSNTAVAVENATKMGYLVPSIKGCKQMSASGEHFVDLLPDRGAAREAMSRARPTRGGRTSKRGKSNGKE